MAEKATVARPYAKAAFAHARDRNTLDAWSGWLGTARAVVMSDEFKAFESSPGVGRQQLKELVASVCGDALDANARSLLDLLAENDRIDYLPEIAVHCTVDPALIGGAVVRSGDMLIDGSLAHKLQRLGVELTTG